MILAWIQVSSGFSLSVDEQMGETWQLSTQAHALGGGGSKHLCFFAFSKVLFYSDVILLDRLSVSFRFPHGPDGCCRVCVKRMLFGECFTFRLGFVIILISFSI